MFEESLKELLTYQGFKLDVHSFYVGYMMFSIDLLIVYWFPGTCGQDTSSSSTLRQTISNVKLLVTWLEDGASEHVYTFPGFVYQR